MRLANVRRTRDVEVINMGTIDLLPKELVIENRVFKLFERSPDENSSYWTLAYLADSDTETQSVFMVGNDDFITNGVTEDHAIDWMLFLLEKHNINVNTNQYNMNEGIQNLKEIVTFVFNLLDAVKTAKENDGKVDFKDWYLLFPLVGEGGVAVENAESILKGWKDGTPEERKEVVDLIKERFDLADDKLETKIEKALDALVLILEITLD